MESKEFFLVIEMIFYTLCYVPIFQILPRVTSFHLAHYQIILVLCKTKSNYSTCHAIYFLSFNFHHIFRLIILQYCLQILLIRDVHHLALLYADIIDTIELLNLEHSIHHRRFHSHWRLWWLIQSLSWYQQTWSWIF